MLDSLSEADLGQLLKRSRMRNFNKGARLFSCELQEDYIYFVVSGWIGVFSDSADGSETIVDILTSGGMTGEHLVFNIPSGELYAEVISPDASLLEVPVADVREMACTRPNFSYDLFYYMTKQSMRLRSQIHQISHMCAAERILVLLLRFAGYDRKKHFYLPLTRTLLASYLGMKRETFSRAQKELEDMGVHIRGKEVVIDDYSRINDDLLSFVSGMRDSEQFAEGQRLAS